MPTLEEQSLWYKYKEPVWNSTTEQAMVIHNTMRMLRSMRNVSALGYISTPVTSGRHMAQELHAAIDRQEARKKVIDANYNRSYAFLEQLEGELSYPLIFPPDLAPVRTSFDQPEFMALWLSVIGEFATHIHMDQDWQYTNGAVEEFTHAWQLKLGQPKSKHAYYNTKNDQQKERDRQRNIQILDHQGMPLSIHDGYLLVAQAIPWLKPRNMPTERLENCLKLLDWTGNRLNEGFYQ